MIQQFKFSVSSGSPVNPFAACRAAYALGLGELYESNDLSFQTST